MNKFEMINVETMHGQRTVLALLSKSRGLAVHQAVGCQTWNVTHVASGRSVVKNCLDSEDAITAAKRIDQLTDWTQPAARLEEDRQLRDRCRQAVKDINGAYV